MNCEIEDWLRQIDNEDRVFIIFIIIIILSYIANSYEKKYFINGLEEEKKKYYYLQIFIFLIVVLVNIYYVVISYKEVAGLRNEEYSNRKKYANLGLIASLFALVAGLIILYISIDDTEIDAEISL